MMLFPLTAYFEAAMELARYEKLEDGSYAGEIPKLPGVVAFGATLRECERQPLILGNCSGWQVHGSTVQGLEAKMLDLHAFPTAEP